jgi:hypothetical protein
MLVYVLAIWSILRPFNINFVAIWYILWSFGMLFDVLVRCTNKNLATLAAKGAPTVCDAFAGKSRFSVSVAITRTSWLHAFAAKTSKSRLELPLPDLLAKLLNFFNLILKKNCKII